MKSIRKILHSNTKYDCTSKEKGNSKDDGPGKTKSTFLRCKKHGMLDFLCQIILEFLPCGQLLYIHRFGILHVFVLVILLGESISTHTSISTLIIVVVPMLQRPSLFQERLVLILVNATP